MSSTAPTQPRWIISFADLLSVVLSFLVLSYSMSLPPNKEPTNYNKEGNAEINAKGVTYTQDISISKTDEDLSTNYLYQIMQKKIAADKEMASKLKFRSAGGILLITVSKADFAGLSLKTAQLLKVIRNNVRIYTSSLDDSKTIYAELTKEGYDKQIIFLQKDIPNTQIDIAIYP